MKSINFKSIFAATAVGSLLAVSACSQAPEAKAQAEKAESQSVKTVNFEPIGIPSGEYVMDKEHGYVTFSYSHFGLSNPQLRFRDIDASVNLDAENLEASQVSAVIKSASIDSGVDRFDDHLNSDGWFDTAKFPEITFESTSFARTGQMKGTMTGDMTIMGITKPMTFEVTLLKAFDHPMKNRPFMGLEGRGTLLRSDFGLGKYAPNVSDEVAIVISGEFGKTE